MRSSLFGVVLIAALGGLLFGFDTAVISGTTDALTDVFELSPGGLGFTVASALIGTIVGAIFAGRPADRLGRRTCLFFIAALYGVSAIGSALASDWNSFIIFRFIGGIGVGAASVVSPMYIAEVSPSRVRGRMVAIFQFNIVLGLLLAYLSNYIVSACELGEAEWRWMFGIETFPAIAFVLLLLLAPRSPRWLMAQKQEDEARGVLDRLGTDSGNVDEALDEIRSSLALERHSLNEPFFRKAYLKPILLVIAIAMFNQLSGINALMYYAPHIFKMAGAGEKSALLQSVGVGAINLVFTLAAMAIIDNFGRRKLMIVGSIGYILSLATTAWAFYTYRPEFTAVRDGMKAVEEAQEGVAKASESAGAALDATGEAALSAAREVLTAAEAALDTATADASQGGVIVLVSLLVFIASHAFGQGAVIWVFISEIFPNRVRARGQALGCFTHWFMAVVISQTFPVIAEWSGGHIFAFYAVMMVLQLIWVLRVMPETKGVPLEQIQKKLGIE